MTWLYDYEAGTSTSDSVDLNNYCTDVLIEDESGGGKAGGNTVVGFLDGERSEPKTYAPLDVVLKTVLRYTNSAGAVTHLDDAAGHVFENLSELKLLFGQPGTKTLTRDAPDYGAVKAVFEMIAAPIMGEARHIFYWPLRIPSGSWQDEAESTATGNPPAVTTGGNRRIHDPEIVFSAAGSFTYTNTTGEVFAVTVASGPTFPVTVSQDNGEWTAVDNAAADAAQYVTATNPAVMMFDPDSVLSIVTTVSCTVNWRNRWA